MYPPSYPPLQLEDAHLRNEISGALEACGPVELTLLAVALLPMERLEALVERVVGETREGVQHQVGGWLCIVGIGP